MMDVARRTLAGGLAGALLPLVISAGPQVHALQSDGLNARQQQIVAIAACTAAGDQKKLGAALRDALDAGVTINEIKEVLVQMYAYAGFPRSLNGLNVLMDVLHERAGQGIADDIGTEPSPLPTDKNSVELGTETLIKLTGSPTTKFATFSPVIDTFLKGHLFGDIFSRDNLDFQSREIATISALATLGDVNPQLQSHFNIGFNTGLTETSMRSLIAVVRATIGEDRADNASAVLADVLAARHTRDDAPSIPVARNTASRAEMIRITRKDAQRVENAPAEHFIGSARVQSLFQANSPSRASGASVTFERGARTAWHSHPLGQTLIVTAGTGWVQQSGAQAQVIREGDVVWIPAGVKHWHGAAATSGMTHIALAEQHDGKSVEWMEKVSDQEYIAVPHVDQKP
jgi:4-carboxymuconolactone decarboxylase